MPSNNNNSSRGNASSYLSFGKGKHGLATVGILVLVIGMGLAYYYIYKSNQDSFTGSSGTPNLTAGPNECIVALFYTEWCGHCKKFKPDFKSAMEKMNGKKSKSGSAKGKTVRFEMIDCDENKELGKEYDISGYPTVKIISNGKAEDYDGERSYNGLKEYLNVDD